MVWATSTGSKFDDEGHGAYVLEAPYLGFRVLGF